MRLELQLFKNIDSDYGEPEWTTIYRSDDTTTDNIAFQDFSLSEGINEISTLSFTMYPNQWVKYFNLDDPDNAVYEVWLLQIEETAEEDDRLIEQGYYKYGYVIGRVTYEKILFAGTVVEFNPVYDDGAVTFEVVCADFREKMRNIILHRGELNISPYNIVNTNIIYQGEYGVSKPQGTALSDMEVATANVVRTDFYTAKDFHMSVSEESGMELQYLIMERDAEYTYRYTGEHSDWKRGHSYEPPEDFVGLIAVNIRKKDKTAIVPSDVWLYYRSKMSPAGLEGAIQDMLDRNNMMYMNVLLAYGTHAYIVPKPNRTDARLEYNAEFQQGRQYHYIIDWETTYDALKDIILDRYGGEIRLDKKSLINNRSTLPDSEVPMEQSWFSYVLEYIDTPSPPSDTSELETLRNYDNLLYLKVNTEREDFCSALIPLGATDLAGNRLTASTGTGIFNISSREMVENYGVKIRTHTWDDVTVESNLATKGAQWMANQNRETKTYEARVYDLSIIDRDRKPIQLGDFYHVVVDTPYLQIDEVLRVISIKRDLFNFHAPEIVLGDKRMSFEELQANAQKMQTNKLNTSIYNTNEAIQELKE